MSTVQIRCDRPAPGWYCDLFMGHDGPCPAWPTLWTKLRLWLRGIR